MATVKIDLVSDVMCPWCIIGYQQLARALEAGATPEGSAKIRQQMTDIGDALGFEFKFSEDSHMWNTFTAHRVLHWAREQGKQTEFKLALFEEHFTKANNPSDPDVLADVAKRLGLNGAEAADIAKSDRYAEEVRAEQQHFRSLGITAVPTYIINGKYAISGAQEPETIAEALVEISQEAA